MNGVVRTFDMALQQRDAKPNKRKTKTVKPGR
jgi:hypothetical protein